MSAAFQISSNVAELIAKFNTLSHVNRDGIIKGLSAGLHDTESQVRRRTLMRWTRGDASLSGRLTSFAREGGRLGIEAAIGFRKTKGFPYELAQEFGAHAGAGKSMTIPLTPEARALSERGLGPRDFPRKLIQPVSSSGRKLNILTGVIMGKGRNKFKVRRLVPQYAMVQSIPPRLHFQDNVIGNRATIERMMVQGGITALAREAKR